MLRHCRAEQLRFGKTRCSDCLLVQSMGRRPSKAAAGPPPRPLCEGTRIVNDNRRQGIEWPEDREYPAACQWQPAMLR